MVLHVVAVGRMRSAGLRAACDDYATRVRRYVKLEIHETPDGAPARAAGEVSRQEGRGLLRRIPPRSVTVALTRGGDAFDSMAFAARLERWRHDARDVTFLVGGAFGLDTTVVERCDERLSLSPLTFPHELARVILMEQLYRGCTIARGEPYHKGA